MYCPRCQTSTSADRTCCPACDWQLSHPFTAEADCSPPRANGGGDGASPAPANANGDNFSLTPPVVSDWARRPQPRHWRGRQRRKLGRRSKHHVSANDGDGGVAVLPEGARWAEPPHLEVVAMPVVQSSFDFDDAEHEAQQLAARASAPVSVRLQACVLDATLVVLAGGIFFALFALLGGHLGLARRDLLIYLLAGYALAVAYFGLFTLLGSQTPGMQHYGLRVVNFEGKKPSPNQALWRAFGYGVSTGSLLLGFLWALADERRLTWHDHISQTFITDRTVL
jgi:uncharacterized RDD family membrane protein YckC